MQQSLFFLGTFLLLVSISIASCRIIKRDTESEEFDRETFDGFDNDSDGIITHKEFLTLLNDHDDITPEDMEAGFQQADTNEDGEITYQEWRAWDDDK